MLDHKVVYPATIRWLDELSRPYLAFMAEDHAKLVTSVRAATGSSAYIVGSKIFGPGGDWKGPLPPKIVPLPAQLTDHHEAWVAGRRRHTQEWVRAQQVLRLVIGRAKNWQELRDMVPDPVLRAFPAEGLMELPRTRPDLYAGTPADPDYTTERTLREAHWDSQLLDLYEQVGPTINLYVSYRLL